MSPRNQLLVWLPLLSLACTASAQSSGGPYRMEPALVAGGGGTLVGGTFELRGSAGQAQTMRSAGAQFGWQGGFWTPASDGIFRNGFDQ